jgi:hypothetical protein
LNIDHSRAAPAVNALKFAFSLAVNIMDTNLGTKHADRRYIMATCGNCLQAIPEGQEKYISGKNNMRITLCSACVTKIETAIHSETQGANAVNALALALGAGLVSALVWYGIVVVTEYQLGIIAVGVGWLVAQAAILALAAGVEVPSSGSA